MIDEQQPDTLGGVLAGILAAFSVMFFVLGRTEDGIMAAALAAAWALWRSRAK